jgi:hypothetical protein
MEKPKSKRTGLRFDDPDQISLKDGYIQIKPNRLDTLEISYLVRNLLAMEGFPERNDLWILSEKPFEMSFVDLEDLRALTEKHYPRKFVGHKTAVVSDDVIKRTMIKIYDAITTNLPVEFRAFSSQAEAEEWLKS